MDNDVMFKIGYGLYVLSANENGKDNGCIVNTVMQVTVTPNRIVVAVNKENYTHDMILRTGLLNLSMLTQGVSFEVFKNFGYQSGRKADKFSKCKNVKRSENGLCYLTEGVNSYLSGKVTSTVDMGTHTMFIAEVTQAKMLSLEPSVTYTYYQDNIKPQPEKETKKGWRCKICGYIHEEDELPQDYICPICKHGAADFEKIG